jgi:hypothetical protein
MGRIEAGDDGGALVSEGESAMGECGGDVFARGSGGGVVLSVLRGCVDGDQRGRGDVAAVASGRGSSTPCSSVGRDSVWRMARLGLCDAS